MKHSLPITIILLATFLLSQFVGIAILYNYIDPVKSSQTGETEFKELPIGERPPLNEETSYIPVIIAILIGTGVLLLLIKLNWIMVWKFWFLLAVVIALGVAFSAFIPAIIAFILAAILGIWKIFRPNLWVQNFTELFIYGGLAAIFSPLFNLWSVSILLVLIAGYDAYAVWKSQHMVTLAKSQMKAKVFAGLLIPYQKGKWLWKSVAKKSAAKKGAAMETASTHKHRTAILGGGDLGFPLIFAGVVLKEIGLWQSLVIPFFALAGLAWLLFIANEKKFYPAMPFIAAGCFVGLAAVLVAGLV